MSDSNHAASWSNRVAQYVDDLAEVTETIDLILDETRVRTIGLQPDEVDESTQALAAAITRLEAMVQRRDDLIRDDHAPEPGLSLSEKLLHSRRIEDARLARRCGEVAEAMATTHSRAMALFVCQYHLSEFQTDLLKRLTGVTSPGTYSAGGKSDANAQRGQQGGGLFNDAA
ncbi:MAG: hypothetical protein AAF539_01335 [Planctomycetota bacterium]